MARSGLANRAEQYARQHGLEIGAQLGAGVHGIVFEAEDQATRDRSAIKIHEHEPDYQRERDAYFRLAERGVTQVGRCTIPELLAKDDSLWILQMTIVTRPFCLDFAGAYLDSPPDFSDEVWADWRTEKAEQFGEHWSEVQSILRTLESHGVYMIDVTPGNISFAV